MAAPVLKAVQSLFDLALVATCNYSHYSSEFQDPLVDKQYYRKPMAKVSEEKKYEQEELRKTQLIKAALMTTTYFVCRPRD